jgi:prepilin-type N-terminal cleavage/methylation domain-containing protein
MRNSKGFTLIELLLVILIIIGLAAIVVPNYMNVSDQSRTATDAANRDALKAAVRLMVLDTGLASMPTGDLNSGGTAPNLASYTGTWAAHGPYISPQDFPVLNPGGAAYAVSVNKTTGNITIN